MRRAVGPRCTNRRRCGAPELDRPSARPMPTDCSQHPRQGGPFCGHGLRDRRAASPASHRPCPQRPPRARRRRAHDGPRRLLRRREDRAARRRAARPGPAGGLVRVARLRRGAGRRLLRAAGRNAARRGPHARRRPPPRPVRRAVGRRARVRARPRRRRPASRRATSFRRRPAAICCRPARCSSATACQCSGARTTSRASGRATAQFDSDITDGRYPRAALGLADGKLFAVACDGRSRHDAGLTLEELAALMAALGCQVALNLDGGGSTSLVSGGRLRNRPRGGWERPEVGGRPVSTALVFLRALKNRGQFRGGPQMAGRRGIGRVEACSQATAPQRCRWSRSP